MPRFTFALALLLTVPAAAQEFPAPGTGVYTWDRVGDRPLDARALSFAPGGRLVAANDTVFTLDPDAGAPAGTWRAVGYNGGLVDALLALDPAGDTLLTGNGGTTVRSVDGGASWAVVNGSTSGTVAGGPDAPDGFAVVPAGHDHAGRLLAGGVILYSDDRGATWQDATQDIPFNQQSYARTFAVLPSSRILAGTGGGVLASEDGGEGYLRTPLYGPYAVNALAPLATPGSRQAGPPSCGLADGALCDGAVAVGSSPLLAGAQAWTTNDGGRTWSEPVALPEPYDGIGAGYTAGVVALSPGPDGLGRAVGVLGRGVVYATRDGGQTWQAVGRMPVFEIGHRTRQVRLGPDGHLWVSTSTNGPAREWVYRSAEPAEAAFIVAGEPLPEGAGPRLDIRPNPAAGRGTVRVSVGGPARSATVAVYDALGRRVATLHDGPMAAGAHDLAFETSALAPGVYVVSVRVSPEGAASWTEVRRVTVAR